MHYLLNDKTTPPTHWNVLCSLDPLDEDTIIPSFMRNIYDCVRYKLSGLHSLKLRIFISLHCSQCVSDGDVMQYKQILRKWINHYMFVHPSPSTLDINLYGLPHAASYITEAEDGHFGDVPSLANNSELQLLFEEAVLNRWLRRIYKEVCLINPELTCQFETHFLNSIILTASIHTPDLFASGYPGLLPIILSYKT